MLQMRLNPCRVIQRLIVPQMLQLLWILLKVPTQLLALRELHPNLLNARLTHRDPCHCPQRIRETVSERLQALHIELPVFDFLPFFLVLMNLRKNFLVVFGAGKGGGFVFSVERLGNCEGDGSTALTGTGGSPYAVEVSVVAITVSIRSCAEASIWDMCLVHKYLPFIILRHVEVDHA